MDILLVEDEPQLAQQVCRALKRAGHAVVGAADGPGGLEAATARHFDLLLLFTEDSVPKLRERLDYMID